MGSAISSSPPDRDVLDLATFAERLRRVAAGHSIPLVVLRVRPWGRSERGRRVAAAFERRSVRSLLDAARRTLRTSDVLGHEAGSTDFLVALLSPMRTTTMPATAGECRIALARLESAMSVDGDLEGGWTMTPDVGDDRALRRAIEAALERGYRERERYDFFSTVGHELRTPLTSIRGYLETLRENRLSAETRRRFVTVALAEAERMGRLVDGLFDLSLIDLRGAETDQSCDAGDAVRAAAAAVAPLAALRGTTVAIVGEFELRVASAPDRVAHVLINLLENAIKHGRENGSIEISVRRDDRRLVAFHIDDDGPGIDEEDRETIFMLARRGRNARAIGTGIGLAVVRLLIERIGGDVDVGTSHLGGARFRVRMPSDESTATRELGASETEASR